MDPMDEGGQPRPGRQALWYVRRHGREVGPHPRQVVVDGLLLGRFEWSDLGSLDRIRWQPLHAFEALGGTEEPVTAADGDREGGREGALAWDGERRAAARRWADERSGRDRRTGRAVPQDGAERRAAGDRRVSDEPLQVLLWRRLRLDRVAWRAAAKEGRVLAAVAMAGVALALAIRMLAPEPAAIPIAAPGAGDCAAAAVPGVDWRGCAKPAAMLAGADLRRAQLAGAALREARLDEARLDYADLTGADLFAVRLVRARLFGANLREAQLRDGDLSGADLSYADLRGASVAGARFEGTRVDHAWWVDGRRCARGSVGRCD